MASASVVRVLAENLQKLFSGCFAVVPNGYYYQKTEVVGTVFTSALSDGEIKAFGLICSLISLMLLI